MQEVSKNKTIGVFFGSRSSEHEVSIITAQLIISELKKLGRTVIPIYIDREGVWRTDTLLDSLSSFTKGDLMEKLKAIEPCSLRFEPNAEKLFLKKSGLLKKEISIDIAFPAFHGTNGEDGMAQSIFEMAGIPYVGCDVVSSAIVMDKVFTKQVFVAGDIPTKPFTFFTNYDWESNRDSCIKKCQSLIWPLFIKPAKLGSSIGTGKAKDISELENACEVAFHYDEKILVEESVESLGDITCAILGNDDPQVSLIQEAIFEGEHFSYEAKYIEDGGAQIGKAENKLVIPAQIDDESTKAIQACAISVFKLFSCYGTARVDFLYDKNDGKYYASEINPLPGTLYHHLWKASGVETGELIKKLLECAIERHEAKKNTTTKFQSDILKFANSIKLQIKE